MARRLLAALALAHTAAANLELRQYVDVLVRVDVKIPPPGALAEVLNAGSDDEGIGACWVGDGVINACYDAGLLSPSADERDGYACLCCAGSSRGVSSAYSSCASYLSESSPTQTAAISIMTSLYGFCANDVNCATISQPPRPSRTRSLAVTPTPCSSLASMFNSCLENEVDINTASDQEVAACLCEYDADEPNTTIQDYASSCAPWASTAWGRQYTLVSLLASVCDSNPPPNTTPLIMTPAGTRTLGVAELGTTTPTPTDEAAEGTSTSSGLAAPGAAVPGALVWAANLATFFLSWLLV